MQINRAAANGAAVTSGSLPAAPASAPNKNWEIPPVATFQRPARFHDEKPPAHSTYNEQKKALICLDDERSQTAAQLLDDAGYTVYLADNPAQATEKIRDADVDVIIFSPDFAPKFNGANVLAQMLNMLPAMERRKVFAVSIDDNLQTFNTHEAFLRNLHLIVNTGDLHHLPSILHRALRDYNELYRYFKQALSNAA